MDKKCPIYRIVGFVGKKWTLLILTELYKGRKKWKRYSHIKKRLPGITPKMLSARLRELNAEDLIRKRVDSTSFPVKSEYRLTRGGEDFIRVIKGMKDWGLKWKVKNEHCETVNCKYCEL